MVDFSDRWLAIRAGCFLRIYYSQKFISSCLLELKPYCILTYEKGLDIMKHYFHLLASLIIMVLLALEPVEVKLFKALVDRTEGPSGTHREAPHDEFESRGVSKSCASVQRQMRQIKGWALASTGTPSPRDISGSEIYKGNFYAKALLKMHLSTTVLCI
jgi:hypothetical protein